MKKRNTIRLSKFGKTRLDYLLNSDMVIHYHKVLLTGIKDRAENKNLSRSDMDIYELLSKDYEVKGV